MEFKRDIPSLFKPVNVALAALVVSSGAAALAGWILDEPLLASLGSGKIPVAPSTAIFFMIEGISFIIYMLGRTSASRRAGFWTHIFIGVISAILLASNYSGHYSEFEHIGFAVLHGKGLTIGHMSPITAFLFILASLSFCGTYLSSWLGQRSANFAWGLSFALMASGLMLSLAYLFGMPMFYSGQLIPPAAATSVAFMLMGLSLFNFALPNSWLANSDPAYATNPLGVYLGLFVLFSMAIITGGYFYYRNYEKHFREVTEKQLSAIAELKKIDLSRWRAERLGDGSMYLNNLDFSTMVGNCFVGEADNGACSAVGVWMNRLRASYKYDLIQVVDSDNRIRISIPESQMPLDGAVVAEISEGIKSREVRFVDFYRDSATGEIHLAVVVPIFSVDGSPIGAVVMNLHPDEFLYPYINRWPMESQSGETLLVKKVVDEVVFLNEIRFNKRSALRLRIPLSKKEVPAINAVLGTEGIVDGLDYRGIPVIAYLLAIPDSPWRMVAKIDKTEAYAPMRERFWGVSMLIGVLILGLGSGFGFIWRRQTADYYRVRYEATEAVRISERRLKRAETMGKLGHWDFNLETELVTMSDEMKHILGFYPSEQAIQHSRIVDKIHPEDRDEYLAFVSRILEDGRAETKYRILGVDGATKHLKGLGGGIENSSGKVTRFFGTAMDITDIMEKERELKSKNEELERFTYTVSHDLKSPLVTIKTFAGYIEKDLAKKDEERVLKDIMFIQNATDKMSRLLDELLELSRVGRKMNSPVEVDFAEVVNEALGLVAGRILQSGAKINLQNKSITFFGDRLRLVELYQNLIDNAIKFMGDQKEPLVEIGAEIVNNSAVLFVKDNGKGIDPRHKDKLFGLFEKLDPGTEGSGVGLALVKRIVDVHDGKIWAESDGVGKGSCFYFTLAKTKSKTLSGGAES